MAEMAQFVIGSKATCSDGDCGEVSRVVVDPVARKVTHLVVEPKHREGLGRLVPLDLVDSRGGEVQLRCSLAEFDKLDPAEETRFLPGNSDYTGYGPEQVLSWPYYSSGGMGMGGMDIGGMGGFGGMGMGGMDIGGMGGFGGMGMGGMGGPQAVTFETLPSGEVGVRRGEHVHATDGPVGRVQGLVIDPSDYHVTHVLLQEGHLWGRREVAIPISAVVGVEDGIQLNITKHEVEHLPPVELDHPTG